MHEKPLEFWNAVLDRKMEEFKKAHLEIVQVYTDRIVELQAQLHRLETKLFIVNQTLEKVAHLTDDLLVEGLCSSALEIINHKD